VQCIQTDINWPGVWGGKLAKEVIHFTVKSLGKKGAERGGLNTIRSARRFSGEVPGEMKGKN